MHIDKFIALQHLHSGSFIILRWTGSGKFNKNLQDFPVLSKEFSLTEILQKNMQISFSNAIKIYSKVMNSRFKH